MFTTPASGPTPLDIAATASAVTHTLDQAAERIKSYSGIVGSPDDIDAHSNALSRVRSLVQQIRFQEDLHVESVRAALGTLCDTVDGLLSCAGGTAAASTLDKIANAVDEVESAARNLESQLLSDYSVAEDNVAPAGSFQLNGIAGGIPSGRRVNSRARGNRAEKGAVQINGNWNSDLKELVEIIKDIRSLAS